MKKIIVTLMLAGMMTAMVACGSTDTTTESEVTTESATEESVEEETEVEIEEEVETPEVEEETEEESAEIDLTTVLAEGTAMDILDAIYATADLDADLKGQIDGGAFDKMEITADIAEFTLGSTEIEFDNAVYSAPMMSSIAYQVIVMQVAEDGDVEATKQALLDNADPMKWVCVEPEVVTAEVINNTILFIMADEATATACTDAFNALVQE